MMYFYLIFFFPPFFFHGFAWYDCQNRNMLVMRLDLFMPIKGCSSVDFFCLPISSQVLHSTESGMSTDVRCPDSCPRRTRHLSSPRTVTRLEHRTKIAVWAIGHWRQKRFGSLGWFVWWAVVRFVCGAWAESLRWSAIFSNTVGTGTHMYIYIIIIYKYIFYII